MKKKTLNYKFNNPNSEDDTADMLIKFFIEAKKSKAEEVIKKAVDDSNKTDSHPT